MFVILILLGNWICFYLPVAFGASAIVFWILHGKPCFRAWELLLLLTLPYVPWAYAFVVVEGLMDAATKSDANFIVEPVVLALSLCCYPLIRRIFIHWCSREVASLLGTAAYAGVGLLLFAFMPKLVESLSFIR